MSWKRTDSRRSRRNVLKKTALAGIGTSTLVMGGKLTDAVAAPKARVVVQKTPAENPIDIRQIENARKAVIEDYVDRGGEKPEVGATPASAVDLEDAPDNKLVGHVFTIAPDGVPTTYFGSVGSSDPGSVADAHQTTAEKATMLRNATTVNDLEGEGE